ncbi:MAG TPA: hypothetical protein VNW06_06145 [Cytophagaceae bacterium]|nr:hypothetical protein [Cytophagaceae bacterium]
MKKTPLLIALLTVLSMNFMYAQDELFKVLASAGSNKVQTQGSTDWKPLFFGKKLMKGDQITVADKGYLGLVFKNGKSIEVKKAGTYKVSDLAGLVAKQNASVNAKYTDFLAGEMGKTGNDDMARNRYKYMSVTGSVVRGTHEIPIFIDSSKAANVLGNQVLIKWEPETNTKTYIVQLTNLFSDVISTQETTQSEIVLNLDSKKEKMYIVTISSKEDKGIENQIRISYPSNDKVIELNKQLTELKAQMPEETAINKVILASFYEDNKLYPEAIQTYETAMKLEPGVEDYKIAYNQFLERAKIAKPVASAK